MGDLTNFAGGAAQQVVDLNNNGGYLDEEGIHIYHEPQGDSGGGGGQDYGGDSGYGGGGGGGHNGGGGYYPSAPPPPPPDPYAKWGGQEHFNQLKSGFDTQKQNIGSTSGEAAQNQAVGLHGSILDFLDSLRTGQRNIDEHFIQNELAKRQGWLGIQGMVGRGLRSGAVMLSNKNALASSAAEALARAYGDIGQRQMSGVGNQYELANRQADMQQQDLEAQRASGQRKIADSKLQAVNGIVLDARNKLAALDASMVDASMPDRINIEQEKEKIKQQTMQTLSQYDQELSSGVAGIQPSSAEDRRRTAFELSNAGTAAESPFDFTTVGPAQFQGTGPASSGLPLFTLPRKRSTA